MIKTTRSIAFFLFLLFFLGQLFIPATGAYEVHVLCYHHFVEGEPEGNSETSLASFKKQMEYLKENDFNVLSLEEFLEHYRGGIFPENSVLLTFDDGYLSFFSKAYPVLQEFDFPAVIFPIVSHMPGLQRTVQFSEKMSFNNLRFMIAESGLIDVGSHTYNLHYYTDNDLPAILQQPGESEEEYRCRIKKDLVTSRNLLQLQTDGEILALAWPYGVYTDETKEIAVDAGFQVFFELGDVPFTPCDDLLAIPRYLVDTVDFDEFTDFF